MNIAVAGHRHQFVSPYRSRLSRFAWSVRFQIEMASHMWPARILVLAASLAPQRSIFSSAERGCVPVIGQVSAPPYPHLQQSLR